MKIFKGHSGAVTTMATDAVGKILYTAGADATVRSWNISTGQILKVIFISLVCMYLLLPTYKQIALFLERL